MGTKCKVVEQLFADGAAAQDFHSLAEQQRFLRDELQHILYKDAVVCACLGAALDNMLIIDKTHAARLYADDQNVLLFCP